MEICVLGSIAVRRGGEEVSIGPRLRRVFAVMVAEHDRVISVDRLVDAVWEGEPPDSAENSLKTYVTRLRQALDPDRVGLISFEDPGYVFRLGEYSLDSDRFEAELDEAVRMHRTSDVEGAISNLEVALARWRGPAYAGFADEEWARPVAVRLEARRLEATELLIEARLASGDLDQAIADAQSLVEAEPLRERPRALLMRALYATARQVDALREFHSFREMLVDESGLDPSSDLIELEARIARNDPSLSGATRALRGYELCERVGQGAFAVVHRATQPGVERDVAIKIVRSELADRPEFVRRFEHEARIVASVEHPHVVPIYDFWREPGAAYLVMRLLRGGSVEDLLRAHGPLSRRATIDVLREVGGALEAAHRKGVVHRDVRPANLLRDEQGVTYLADFGIALPTATAEPSLMASPEYASPEVLRGDPVGFAADVHSLGITTFELLTGRLPFADSNDRAELIRRQLAEPLPSARAVRTDLPEQIDDVLARATAKASEDRYATVGALVADLIAVLDSTTGARGTHGASTQGRVPSEPIFNPYVGLGAFDERHASTFFGRSGLVTELVESLAARPLVVVVGPSGSGKSSVVRAGLVPALRRGALPGSDEWLMTTMIPGADPVDALEVALLRVAVNPPASLREQLSEPGGLLRAIRRVLPADDARLLIVIDQFEELFTMAGVEEHERFLAELAAALAAPGSPVRVVATLRADHYDVPLRHPTFANIATEGTVTVRPMTPSELEEVIVKPAASVGVDVEPALVAELVAGVSQRPAALPLLQFALTEAFERRVSNVMLASVHHEQGGLTGAVAATADRIVDTGDEADAAESRLIFGRLVTLGEGVEDTRRRALRSEFGSGERTAWLLDAFASARLLTLDRDAATRQPTVEVAHEALLRDWPRLRSWLQEDRVDLRSMRTIGAAATAWQTSGREGAELAGGGRLTVAAELFERRPELFNELEAAWVTASSAAADAEEQAAAAAAEKDRRQNRRLRQLLGMAAVLLAVAVMAAGVAAVLRGRAVASEEVAVRAREDADIGRIAALSASQAGVAPEVSILLALEANRRRSDLDTQAALQQSIAASSEVLELRSEPLGEASTTEFSRDGRVALTRTISFEAGTAGWFDTATGEQIGSFFQSEVGIEASAISTDGSTTALGLVDGTIRIVGVSGEELVAPIRVGTSVRSLALDRSGDRLLVLGDFQFSVIETESGAVVSTYQVDEESEIGGIVDIFGVLSDDGSFFVVEFDNRSVAPDGIVLEEEVTAGYDIVDAATGERIERVVAAEVRTMALSSLDTLVVGYADGRVDVRTLATEDEATNLVSLSGAIEVVGVRWDGSIGVVDQSGLRLWGTDGSLLLGPMPIGGAAVKLGFREDGAAVVALLGGGTIVVDPLWSVMIDQSHPTDLSNNVFTELPFYEARNASGTAGEFRRLTDNEVVQQTPFEESYPNGFGADPFYSSDGAWSLTLGVEVTDPQVVTEVLGDRRYVVDVVSAYRNAVGSSYSLESIYTGRPAVDGQRLFFAVDEPSSEGALAMWIDTTTSEVVAGPIELTAIGPALTLPDGRVVLGAPEGLIQILPADLDNEPVVLVPGTEGFNVFDQDENTGLLLIGAADGRVGILDMETATFRLLDDAPGALTAGSFSPSGDRIAVLAPEVGLQLLDVATGRRVGVVMGLRGPILRHRAVRWAEDGSGVWVATTDGPVRFSAEVEGWRAIACSIVDRELTLEEWQRLVSPTAPPVAACG